MRTGQWRQDERGGHGAAAAAVGGGGAAAGGDQLRVQSAYIHAGEDIISVHR